MMPTVLTNRCPCGGMVLESRGVRGCVLCDLALDWTTNKPVSFWRRLSRNKALQFALIVAACWVPAIALVAWWWHR